MTLVVLSCPCETGSEKKNVKLTPRQSKQVPTAVAAMAE